MNIWPIALFSLLAATAAHAQVTEVDAGQWHTCALLTGGAVKCWGDNDYGQLGDGTTTNRASPVEVSGITTATSIALGPVHSCAVLTDGKVKCWGWNAYGQLGDGTTTHRANPPVEVSGITNATSIALGPEHSCALLTDGTMKCWGRNYYGALGDGTTTQRTTPVEVSGLILAFPSPPCTCCQARLKKLGLHVDEECRLF